MNQQEFEQSLSAVVVYSGALAKRRYLNSGESYTLLLITVLSNLEGNLDGDRKLPVVHITTASSLSESTVKSHVRQLAKMGIVHKDGGSVTLAGGLSARAFYAKFITQ